MAVASNPASPENNDGDTLLERARQGDLDAFGQIIHLHQKWVRGYLRGQLRDWASADDLAQDVFVTAFRKLKSYRADSSLESWLRGIAHNHLRNFIRKRREEYVGGNEELERVADAACERWAGRSSGYAHADALHDCLETLEGSSREIVTQRYVMGKTVREIAAETGRGYSALTMQLYRVREALGKCIEGKVKMNEA